MFNRLVHKAVHQRVPIAIRNPNDIPINMLSKLNANSMPSAPALANTLLNARDTNQAKKIPNNPPRIEAPEEVIIPSINARDLISERFRPIARIIASSTLRDSASIITMVRTKSMPAPIVNAPNTRNIAERAPAPSSAAAKAFSLAATILIPIVSAPEISSSQALMAERFPSFITSILRSPSAAAANTSPSLRLTKPIIIDSNSSNPGASIEDIFPPMSKIIGSESPYAQGINPLISTSSV